MIQDLDLRWLSKDWQVLIRIRDACDWFFKGFERCGFSGFGYFVLADTKMQHP
jgi:hypothetical protein